MNGNIYLLDTNVVSELMRPEPSPLVLGWIDSVGIGGLAISAITRWEIRYGLALLAQGKRREDLALRFDGLITDLFGAGTLDFTSAAAEACVLIMARKRALGESLDEHLPDAMIAGIASAYGMTVATRNRAEFRNCGLALVNPWDSSKSQLS
ncbi:MAG: type II toxin-antitoxin system VapC family toxin [Lamprobacter sp.]|uniref:type II toxin-antitoxin system VapC family toxin n=1 Tax=Lamprobacter sp. TaxID=3100796 RepID=UPI002B263A0B|nr:type II toxin-antitoxin system VapC family toxin [Lamprobacter sp.]MEA3640810.1 type II toxin-antitoxin system VapC family toxin [Lamprobacter sp.]